MSTKLAEILSNALCGEGIHPEIFISRLALGANQTSKNDHERIYKVHNEFLHDVSHLLFSASAAINSTVTEFYDSGETITRTPRQWAKSLVSPEGESLEVDLENGGTQAGKAVLVVPSASLLLLKAELQSYWARRNPTLSHAAKLYKESVSSHPDIPKTVFTKNIDTILSKKFRKRKDVPGADDASSVFSPVSSLTGGVTETTSIESIKKASIAWRKPLQDTLLTKTKALSKKTMSSLEINQRKTIAILEAQLELRSGENSVTSQTSKSVKSKASRSSSQSGLTAASAHSRMDKYETSLEEIKDLLKQLAVNNNHSTAVPGPVPTADSVPIQPTPWVKVATAVRSPGHGMSGVQLFPENQDCSSLVLLGTPKKVNKRRKATSPPPKSPSSNLSLQYTEHTGTSGGDPC